MADNLTQAQIAAGASTATKQLPDSSHAGKNFPVDAQGNYVDLSSAGNAAAITPGSSALSFTTRAVYVGGAGDLVARINGNDITFKSVPAGALLPIKATHILGSSTASFIVGLG